MQASSAAQVWRNIKLYFIVIIKNWTSFIESVESTVATKILELVCVYLVSAFFYPQSAQKNIYIVLFSIYTFVYSNSNKEP